MRFVFEASPFGVSWRRLACCPGICTSGSSEIDKRRCLALAAQQAGPSLRIENLSPLTTCRRPGGDREESLGVRPNPTELDKYGTVTGQNLTSSHSTKPDAFTGETAKTPVFADSMTRTTLVLIIPWSCVRITRGLVVFADFRRRQSPKLKPKLGWVGEGTRAARWQSAPPRLDPDGRLHHLRCRLGHAVPHHRGACLEQG